MEIQFDSKTHTYIRNGEEYSSVSRIITKFKPPFPRKAIAKAVANRDGVGEELILAQWHQKAMAACNRGNVIHEALELCERDGIIPEDPFLLEVVKNFAAWKAEKKGKSFPEEIIYSDKYKVAGTVDLPMKGRNYIDIWDYKTNAEMNNLNKNNKFYLHGLEHIGDTKYQGYALQLSVYAAIYMEIGFKPRNLGILWIDEYGKMHEIFVPFLKNEALIILENYAKY